MLGTKTGFTASLHWASSTRFSHIHTQFPPCFRHLEGKHKAFLAPPGTAQHSEPLLFLCPRWAALNCPSKGQIFGALQPILPCVASILLARENCLSSASKQCLLKDHSGMGKERELYVTLPARTPALELYWSTVCISSHLELFLGDHLQPNLMDHMQTHHQTAHLALGLMWIKKVVCISSSVLSTSSKIQTS